MVGEKGRALRTTDTSVWLVLSDGQVQVEEFKWKSCSLP